MRCLDLQRFFSAIKNSQRGIFAISKRTKSKVMHVELTKGDLTRWILLEIGLGGFEGIFQYLDY